MESLKQRKLEMGSDSVSGQVRKGAFPPREGIGFLVLWVTGVLITWKLKELQFHV